MPSFAQRPQGPAAAFVIALLLSAIRLAGAGEPLRSSPGEGGIARLGCELLGAPDGSLSMMVCALLVSGLAALTMALARCWTQNSAVSLSAALLLVAHPGIPMVELLADPLRLVLAPLLVVAALLAREGAYEQIIAGNSPLRWELTGWLLGLLAALCGPAGWILVLVVPLSEVVFHRGPGAFGVRRRVPLFLLYALSLGIVALLGPMFTPLELRPNEDGIARALCLSEGVPPGMARGGLWVLVGLAALFPLAVGLRHFKRQPRWLLLHAGFGGAWFVACEAPEFLGLVSRGSWMGVLSLLGPALALSSASWRALVSLWPEPERVGSPPAPPELHPQELPKPEAPRISEVVEELLHTLAPEDAPAPEVEPATDGGQRALVLDEAWKRARRRRAARIAAAGLLEREERRDLLLLEVEPLLEEKSRVAILDAPGLGGRELAALAVDRGAHALLVDPGVDAKTLASCEGSWALRGDLESIELESLDLVLGLEAPAFWDSHRLVSRLRQLCRTLRPGGRALIAFIDLEDEGGRDAFLHALDDEAPIFGTSATILSGLARANGLEVEGVRPRSNDRCALARLRRP